VLKKFDTLANLILDDATEHITGQPDRPIGLVVVRGTQVGLITSSKPEVIPNPYE
jgi:small nuclear ribonucleoprotein (snRNP)-like protein